MTRAIIRWLVWVTPLLKIRNISFSFLWQLSQLSPVHINMTGVIFESQKKQFIMMMSSNGSIFHVTGPLCWKFIGSTLSWWCHQMETFSTLLAPCAGNSSEAIYHDDVIKWKHFPHYWPLVLEIHRKQFIMMMSSNRNIFHVTGPLCLKFIGSNLSWWCHQMETFST